MDSFLDVLKIIGLGVLLCFIVVGILGGINAFIYSGEPVEPIVNEYEVVSVYQYTDTVTNKFGGVIRTDVKYCFTYIGSDGQLHEFDGFTHTEYGMWKLHVGKENKYVEKDGERHLYLTKETFKNLSKGE